MKTFRVESATVWSAWISFNGLQVVSLNSVAAREAKGSVALMVVLCAVWTIVEDVEIGSLERRVTVKADKAATVIPSSEAAIRG